MLHHVGSLYILEKFWVLRIIERRGFISLITDLDIRNVYLLITEGSL